MNAVTSTAFLGPLGALDANLETLDERTLRRAYAKRLKQVDPEADPAGFQALREALEAGLAWLAARARAAATAPTGEAATSSAPESTTASTSAEAAAAPASAAASATAPALPPAETAADALFGEFHARVTGGLRDEAQARAWLDEALADERTLSIDGRTFFEWRVACLLANGWRPGHEHLLAAAVDAFGWASDPTRLGLFRQVGAVIAVVAREQAAFDALERSHRGVLRELLARLRQGDPPDLTYLPREIPQLKTLVERFPNWLPLVAPREHVTARIDAWNRMNTPAVPATATGAGSTRRPAPQAARKQVNPWLVAAFVLVLGLATHYRPASTRPGSSPATPALPAWARPSQRSSPPPLNAATIDADLRQRQAEVDRLFREAQAGGGARPAFHGALPPTADATSRFLQQQSAGNAAAPPGR